MGIVSPLKNLEELDLANNQAMTGDIKVLEACRKLIKLHLQKCKVSGDIKALEHCTQLTVVYMSYTDVQGKFEDFKVLGALLELNITYCKKIDCKNALEV